MTEDNNFQHNRESYYIETLSHPSQRSDNTATMMLVGHSTVLINMYGTRILTDPVFFSKIGIHIGKWKIGMQREQPASLHIHNIPTLDYVILSHAHMDHWDMESLRALTQRFPDQIHFICPQHTSILLKYIPHKKDVTELKHYEEIHINSTTTLGKTSLSEEAITFRAGEVRHRGARRPWEQLSRTKKQCNSYLITYHHASGKTTKLVFGGDTALTDSYKKLAHNVDIAIMPIGAYQPWENNHCTPEQAVEMAQDMQAKRFFPVHFGTFILDYAPLHEPMERLKKALSHTGDNAISLCVDSIGGVFALST